MARITKKQLRRIEHCEKVFDNLTEKVESLKKAITELESARPLVKELEEYYAGEWRKDFETDEKGLLPPDLKRGVLSEDGIYNLLEEINELEKTGR